MFFKEAYNFMENKYGKENVISAYVHLDETSPHMHFCFVPVVFDTKKQEYKVNAKVCINRTELLKIHPQMQEYLESKLQTKVNILNGATAEGNKTVEQLKKEEKIKKAAIKELVKNPTEEIKTAVMEQLPEEQKENIIEQEIEIVKEELKKDPQFVQMCKNKAMAEMENIEELEIKIENLQTKKDYMEESIAEFEIQQKKKRKELSAEYEKQKQIYNARVFEMQNTTIEKEQQKVSFWQKIEEMVAKSKLVATVCYAMTLYDKGMNGKDIFIEVKKFRKRYDKYRQYPEILKSEMELLEKDEYTKVSIEDIAKSELEDIRKEQEKHNEFDYGDMEM